MDHPAKPPQSGPPEQVPPPAATPRDDVTLTLFDALQATKPSQKASSKSAFQNSIEIVGETTATRGIAGLPLSPRLALALVITLVVTLGIWLAPKRSSVPSVSKAAAVIPPAPPLANTPSSNRFSAPTRPQTAPPLPKSLPAVQRNWSTMTGNGAGVGTASTASEDREKERERERDREYEREREREKRRQMEAWKPTEPTSVPAGRAADDPALIEGARGYKDPNAVLRERDRARENLENPN